MESTSHLAIKLKQARLALGLSTRKVADRLAPRVPVSHATLANYEAGRSQPTMDVLSALSVLYERPLTWFLNSSLTLRNIRYRNRKSRVTQSELARYQAHAVKWLQAYAALERTLEEPLVPDEKLRGFRIKPRETGAAAASRLRQELDLAEDDKITSVTEIMDRLAIRSIELPTHMALDGFAAQADSEFVVVLNSAVKADRARLNAAHEIGHVLAGDCETDDIDNEGPNEKRAFDFASHLLLTDTMLREAFKQRSMVRLVQFKERFGISVAAMIYRAQKTRGLLPESVAKRIWIEINRRGWKHDEPGHVAEDRAIRFERLVDTALIEGRLTLEQAAELSGVRSDELRERREWALRLVAWQAPAPSVSREDEKPFLRLVT